ncbi:MAG: hypothetical protein U9O87_00420 [Verrucomicrobiota bacterium]|nr:hypothetical protein [Verrucomicrobiota bacterium]
MKYAFPVKNKFYAREVTELDFDPQGYDKELYVELNTLRADDYLGKIKYNLNIDVQNDELSTSTETYNKIIFSGHRGCGKTTELRKFHEYADNSKRYSSIFIEFEKETNIADFQPEDLYVLLISSLIKKIKGSGIDVKSSYLEKILQEWMTNEEIVKELKDTYDITVGSEAGGGTNFFGFLKLSANFKSIFSKSSEIAKIIRRKIKKNPMNLIDKFNEAVSDVRNALKKNNKSRDILFVLDGTEKMPYEIYDKIFIKEPHLLRAINANMIFSVPINSYFDICRTPIADFFHTEILPMIPVTSNSSELLQKIVSNRIDYETFFETGVLTYLVGKSGGCPRQLLRLVNLALTFSAGEKITIDVGEKACLKAGRELYDLLDSEHLHILQSQKFDSADGKVLDLLFRLVVFKYNGNRKVNPLIKDLLKSK